MRNGLPSYYRMNYAYNKNPSENHTILKWVVNYIFNIDGLI